MLKPVYGHAQDTKDVLVLMETFEKHGAQVVSITENPHEYETKFKVFGFVENADQSAAIAADIAKINESR